MYRIRTCHYPDGRPYIRVDLPPLSDPQLYILESVVDAIWSVIAPQAGPTFVWLPSQQLEPGCRAEGGSEPCSEQESPRAATLGQENPTHPSTDKGETDEHRFQTQSTIIR